MTSGSLFWLHKIVQDCNSVGDILAGMNNFFSFLRTPSPRQMLVVCVSHGYVWAKKHRHLILYVLYSEGNESGIRFMVIDQKLSKDPVGSG